jgi:GAF domain-containing protein
MSTSQPLSSIPSSSRPAAVRLLTAVDFSEIARLVVQEATVLARAKRASQLHFVHVHASPLSAEISSLRHAELLEWLAPRLRGLPGLAETKIIAHEVSGDPARMIRELASDPRSSTWSTRRLIS